MWNKGLAVAIAGLVVGLATAFFVTSLMGPSPDAPSEADPLDAAFETATELLRAGDPSAAERLASEIVREVERRHGPTSPETAAALYELASLRAGVGDLHGAITAMRRASELRPTDDQTLQDRLTYRMNLGELLATAGELEEAEQMLRVNLGEREELYGPDHPGVAYGLEVLADVVHARGRPADALEAVERACAIYVRHNHQQTASCLALRGYVRKAAHGLETAAFQGVETLGADMLPGLVAECRARAETEDPALTLNLLLELRDLVETTLGPDDPHLLDIVSLIANTARWTGDHQTRIDAIEWVLDRHDAADSSRDAVHAVQGLALALSEAGRSDDAKASYLDAVGRAERLDDRATLSAVSRNAGLYFAEREDSGRARQLLESAVTHGEASSDPTVHGRALGAFGIFLQHQGELDDAGDSQRRALELLSPAHPDAVFVRGHLEALDAGRTCGCAGETAVSDALRAFVLDRLPPDLVGDLVEDVVVVIPESGPPQVSVATTRKPTDDEAALINRVVNQGLAELHRQYLELGYDSR